MGVSVGWTILIIHHIGFQMVNFEIVESWFKIYIKNKSKSPICNAFPPKLSLEASHCNARKGLVKTIKL